MAEEGEADQFLRGCIKYRESLDRELPDAPRTDADSDEGIEAIDALTPSRLVADVHPARFCASCDCNTSSQEERVACE